MSHMDKVFFKAQYGDELRRLGVDFFVFSSVLEAVSHAFGLDPACIRLTYEDNEGDMVTISTDEELHHALSLLLPQRLLKLVVSLRAQPPAPPAPTRLLERLSLADPKGPSSVCLEERRGPILCEAGSAVTTTFSLLNDGPLPWPEPTFFRYVRGERLVTDTPHLLVNEGRAVLPGQTAVLTVAFTAPAVPGRFVSLWRLSSVDTAPSVEEPGQGCFGAPVRVVVVVRGDNDGERGRTRGLGRERRMSALEDRWRTELEALEKQGFTHKPTLIRLLNKTNGDVDAVVRRLAAKRGSAVNTAPSL